MHAFCDRLSADEYARTCTILLTNPGSSEFGLISDVDFLWRNDVQETQALLRTRAVAFLAKLFAVESPPVVGIVTHSEMIAAFADATGQLPGYSKSANTEVMPMLVERVV